MALEPLSFADGWTPHLVLKAEKRKNQRKKEVHANPVVSQSLLVDASSLPDVADCLDKKIEKCVRFLVQEEMTKRREVLVNNQRLSKRQQILGELLERGIPIEESLRLAESQVAQSHLPPIHPSPQLQQQLHQRYSRSVRSLPCCRQAKLVEKLSHSSLLAAQSCAWKKKLLA